ncbi:hypothetical protein QFZ20_004367 [Flavobacterium sp. W4I14]|nr:hypothetical protein [Flavobacterium sp. W4I14]
MEKKTLSNLLEGKIFRIPDYQRGYAWDEKQWKDFVEDIDALIDDKILSHYTGTIVIYQAPEKSTENYGTKKLELVDVVDGQQRLTTCSLYLSIIINELIRVGENDFVAELPIYLYAGSKSKLRLNNDTADFYFDLITKGVNHVKANTVHQKRLLSGYHYLKSHIHEQIQKRAEDGIAYLKELFDALIRKLNFSFYPIEVESEIGMTFELMNSRGKDLSAMELLKNYLMYWIYRNIPQENEKEDFTRLINKTWKEVYTNIASCNGSENQCLRIAWTLHVSHTPKHWDNYRGFKSEDVIPLRDFSVKSKEQVKAFITTFVNGLGLISKHYASILKPDNTDISLKELDLLAKIKNAGNIANYLPLMVAAKIKNECKSIEVNDYLSFLKALENFSFRVFLWEGRRSNSGLSKFYRWADDIFKDKFPITNITEWIYGTLNWYSNENGFRKELYEDFFDWYQYSRLLKYTLFEYELFLLNGRNKPKLGWDEITDATIEHILPQNPKNDSLWLQTWNPADIRKYQHDISNLVLTKDNSRYLNFEFNRKKGEAGSGFCYANSDIRQEREISDFSDWTSSSCESRRVKLLDWIVKTWGVDKHYEIILDEMVEEEEDLDFAERE